MPTWSVTELHAGFLLPFLVWLLRPRGKAVTAVTIKNRTKFGFKNLNSKKPWYRGMGRSNRVVWISYRGICAVTARCLAERRQNEENAKKK